MADETIGHRASDGAWEWAIEMQNGSAKTFRHEAPDILPHYYEPAAVGAPILLYQGKICSPASEADDDAYDGDVQLRWLPKPHVAARGARPIRPGRLEEFIERHGKLPKAIWIDRRTIRLPGAKRVPPVSISEATLESEVNTERFSDNIYPPEMGNGTGLTRLTALLVNGFKGRDAAFLVAPADRRQLYKGRTLARGDGWLVTLDDLGVLNQKLWDTLEAQGGYAATHVVELTREDNSAFGAKEATDALEAISCSLNIALGRRVDTALPVGWQGDTPRWSRWTAGRAEAFSPVPTWLDPMSTSRQIGEAIGRVLDCWPDKLRRETLFYASSYYLQSLAQYTELGTASAVSGLLLLASSWLLEEKKVYQRTPWDSKSTQEQIRALLDIAECRISTAVPPGFDYLADVAKKIYKGRNFKGAEPDGLDCIIKMRNDVVHPTRKRRGGWTYQEWAEAHNLVVHFLELSLLAYMGYRGQYSPRISVKHAGSIEDMPWSGC